MLNSLVILKGRANSCTAVRAGRELLFALVLATEETIGIAMSVTEPLTYAYMCDVYQLKLEVYMRMTRKSTCLAL